MGLDKLDHQESPRVGIVMGSDSDWPVMKDAAAWFRGDLGNESEA